MSDTPTMDKAPAENQAEAGNDNENLQRAQLDPLSGKSSTAAAVPAPQPGSDVGLELILDVPVTVTLELGRTSLTVRDLLQLNQGSVVEFDRRVGEPLDLLANGTLLAHGELVVVDEQFGIRLTDVVSPAQRLEKLN